MAPTGNPLIDFAHCVKPKSKKYTREQAYDKLYKLACKLLDRMQACSKCPIFVKDYDTKTSCGFSKAWCCDGCPFLDKEKGCTVEALTCRMWFCTYEGSRQRRENGTLFKRMQRVKAIAASYNLILARATKEQTLEYAGKVPVWHFYNQMTITGKDI